MTRIYQTLSILLIFAATFASGMVKADNDLPSGVIATVNGTAIPQSLLDQSVQASVRQGQKDSPELRQAIKNELIGREVVAQEATRLNLDKTPTAQQQFAQLKQNFLIDLAVIDYLTKHPATESDLRSFYDRQVKELTDAQQYKLRLITVATEAEAKSLLSQINKSKSDVFPALAKEKSIDASKQTSGALDWVVSTQIIPAIGNVIVNLPKGGVAASPIQTPAGWNIVRVEDKRPFKAPAFEDSKNQLANEWAQKMRMEYAQQLRNAAKIVD
jgi:peptidyl-prolyl cis-trans isomerase C